MTEQVGLQAQRTLDNTTDRHAALRPAAEMKVAVASSSGNRRAGKGHNKQDSKTRAQSRPYHNMHKALQSVRPVAEARPPPQRWRESQPLSGHNLRKQVPLSRRLSTAPTGGRTNAAPRVQQWQHPSIS